MPGLTLPVLSSLTSTLKVVPIACDGINVVVVVPESTTLNTGVLLAALTVIVARSIGMTMRMATAKATKDFVFKVLVFMVFSSVAVFSRTV